VKPTNDDRSVVSKSGLDAELAYWIFVQVNTTTGNVCVKGCWTTEDENVCDYLVGKVANRACEILFKLVVGGVECDHCSM